MVAMKRFSIVMGNVHKTEVLGSSFTIINRWYTLRTVRDRDESGPSFRRDYGNVSDA